jgi:hypothetical protein
MEEPMQTIDFDLATLSEGTFDVLMPTADLIEKQNASLGQVIRGDTPSRVLAAHREPAKQTRTASRDD